MLNRPSPSVMTVRTFSISAGLAASTVTPGRTAPEASLTTPAIPLAAACWARVARGTNSAHITRATPTTVVRTILQSSCRTGLDEFSPWGIVRLRGAELSEILCVLHVVGRDGRRPADRPLRVLQQCTEVAHVLQALQVEDAIGQLLERGGPEHRGDEIACLG